MQCHHCPIITLSFISYSTDEVVIRPPSRSASRRIDSEDDGDDRDMKEIQSAVEAITKEEEEEEKVIGQYRTGSVKKETFPKVEDDIFEQYRTGFVKSEPVHSKGGGDEAKTSGFKFFKSKNARQGSGDSKNDAKNDTDDVKASTSGGTGNRDASCRGTASFLDAAMSKADLAEASTSSAASAARESKSLSNASPLSFDASFVKNTFSGVVTGLKSYANTWLQGG